MTEQTVLEVIEKIAKLVSPGFVFGYYDIDDIKQFCRIEGVLAMRSGKYDESRPLENFLFRHIKNRLINLKRDKFKRSDTPCRMCHNGQPCQPDGQKCKKYLTWSKRNNNKSNIMAPSPIEDVGVSKSNEQINIDNSEIILKINDNLGVENRKWFLILLEGIKIPRNKMVSLKNEIELILWEE